MQMSVRVRDLNDHITCGLCKGYLVTATLVTECLHACKRSIRNLYTSFRGVSLLIFTVTLTVNKYASIASCKEYDILLENYSDARG